MTDAELIKSYADRIRGGQKLELGVSAIEIVKANRGRAECFEDCDLIIRSYPADFPMTQEMQAH